MNSIDTNQFRGTSTQQSNLQHVSSNSGPLQDDNVSKKRNT